MKRRALLISAIILFVIGICIMAYPFVGSIINQYIQEETIGEYDSTIAKMDKERLDREREAAIGYNAVLIEQEILTDSAQTNAEKNDEYEDRLCISGDGIMGYVEIPAIDVKLAIYHGTTDEVLKKGVGHLESTSLPVGGTGTHAVLTAHTAYPSAVYFDNLKKLEKGSIFILTVLDEKLAYEVDQIKTVEPEEIDDLRIDRKKDYATLLTCTPYGINTHRLLVRAHRVPYSEEAMSSAKSSTPCCIYILIALIILIIINIIQLIFIIIIWRKHRKKDEDKYFIV